MVNPLLGCGQVIPTVLLATEGQVYVVLDLPAPQWLWEAQIKQSTAVIAGTPIVAAEFGRLPSTSRSPDLHGPDVSFTVIPSEVYLSSDINVTCGQDCAAGRSGVGRDDVWVLGITSANNGFANFSLSLESLRAGGRRNNL